MSETTTEPSDHDELPTDDWVIGSSPYIEDVVFCNYLVRKDGDTAESLEDLQAREFPQTAISEEAVCL